MAKDKSSGDSESTKLVSEDGDFNEVEFLNRLSKEPPEVKEDEESTEESEESETESGETEGEDESEQETEDVETEDSEESKDEDDDSEDDDVLSQIDVDALTDEQKAELATVLGSGAGKEIGKLRGKNKELQDQVESLQKQLDEGLSSVVPGGEFSDISTLDALKEKETEVENSLKYLNALLVKTDEFFEINNEEVSREKVAEWREYYEQQARKIPERRNALRELEKTSSRQSETMKSARQEVSFLEDEDSDLYKSWKKKIDDPKFAILKNISPQTWGEIMRMAAHSVEFLEGKPKAGKKLKLPLKKPKAIAGKTTGARPAKPSNKEAKTKEAARRNIQSGEYSEKDLQALIFGQ